MTVGVRRPDGGHGWGNIGGQTSGWGPGSLLLSAEYSCCSAMVCHCRVWWM